MVGPGRRSRGRPSVGDRGDRSGEPGSPPPRDLCQDAPMRVFLTGAGGQLGHDLVTTLDALPSSPDVVAVDHASLDVADRDAVLTAIGASQPDVVIHAAAWTAVDACEGDPDRAFAINALGCRHVAEASARAGAPVYCVSTDYVF